MQTSTVIASLLRLRLFFGVMLALGIFGSQVAAYAMPAYDEATQLAPQDGSDDAQDSEQLPALKAPEGTQGVTAPVLPLLDGPAYRLSLASPVVVYPHYDAAPLHGGHLYRTLFRQIISPNAP